jgi:hypothetical protein
MRRSEATRQGRRLGRTSSAALLFERRISLRFCDDAREASCDPLVDARKRLGLWTYPRFLAAAHDFLLRVTIGSVATGTAALTAGPWLNLAVVNLFRVGSSAPNFESGQF